MRLVVVSPDRVQHIGTGVGSERQPSDGAVDTVCLVTVLLDEEVGASVDDNVDTGGVGGLARVVAVPRRALRHQACRSGEPDLAYRVSRMCDGDFVAMSDQELQSMTGEFKERYARLRESVRLMRELWLGDRVDFDGDYYKTKGASIYDVPDGGIPVYIAAGGPVVARYAGRAGDGFICTSGKGPELYTEKLIPAVREGAEKVDRNFAEIDRMIEIKISYDPDPQLALENCRFWAPLSLTADQKNSVNSSTEMERLADELPIEQVAKRWIVASDPDEAVEKATSSGSRTWRIRSMIRCPMNNVPTPSSTAHSVSRVR